MSCRKVHICKQHSRWERCQQECSRLSAWLSSAVAAEAVYEAEVASVQVRVAGAQGQGFRGLHVSI